MKDGKKMEQIATDSVWQRKVKPNYVEREMPRKVSTFVLLNSRKIQELEVPGDFED